MTASGVSVRSRSRSGVRASEQVKFSSRVGYPTVDVVINKPSKYLDGLFEIEIDWKIMLDENVFRCTHALDRHRRRWCWGFSWLDYAAVTVVVVRSEEPADAFLS